MRIVRDYFGLDRTTVVYDNEITGVGGNANEFFVVAEIGRGNGVSSARTTVTFSHDEMTQILAEYRHHYPIDSITNRLLIGGPRMGGILLRIQRRLSALFRCPRGARKQTDEHRGGA